MDPVAIFSQQSMKFHNSHHAIKSNCFSLIFSLEFKEPPIYGADVSRSFTDPDLKVWNIAKLDSILKYLEKEDDTVIQGVNSPYLYFGMWRATFSWHVEDMDLYGLNMVHYGNIF